MHSMLVAAYSETLNILRTYPALVCWIGLVLLYLYFVPPRLLRRSSPRTREIIIFWELAIFISINLLLSPQDPAADFPFGYGPFGIFLGMVPLVFLVFVWPFIVLTRERRRGSPWSEALWDHISLIAFCGIFWIKAFQNERLAMPLWILIAVCLWIWRFMYREYRVPDSWL